MQRALVNSFRPGRSDGNPQTEVCATGSGRELCNFSFVAGPAGAKIEIVERPGLKPGDYAV
jgi:hypothetical protein